MPWKNNGRQIGSAYCLVRRDDEFDEKTSSSADVSEWGIVATLMGVTQNFSGFLAT
jgi:hypothetical protein